MDRPQAQKMEVIVGEAQHIGYGQSRTTLEDRCVTRTIRTAGGLRLTVGVVADGMGGVSAGERAGQLTVDSILQVIQSATETDINRILHRAIAYAHKAVVETAKSNVKLRTMGTTVTVAAIHGEKLYVGHVGDSRAYLVRDGKIKQLTIDHTWGNEKVRAGQFTLEEIQDHSRRDHLERYIGAPIRLEIDIGVRLDDLNPATSKLVDHANLKPGDVVMLCSDGLIKERRGLSGHYAEDREIVNVVERNAPQDAANTLVSLALGRQVDDNVSVVILEIPGKKKKIGLPIGVSPTVLVAGIGGVALFILVALIIVLVVMNNSPTTPETTEEALMQTVNLPTVEAGYALVSVEDGDGEFIQSPGDAPQPLKHDSTIEIIEGSQVIIYDGVAKLNLPLGTMLYLPNDLTRVRFVLLEDPSKGVRKNIIQLEEGKILVGMFQGNTFVQLPNGYYVQGEGRATFAVELMDEHSFVVDCFLGNCQVLDDSQRSIQVLGEQRSLEVIGGVIGEDLPAYERAQLWRMYVLEIDFEVLMNWALATQTPAVEDTATPDSGLTAAVELTATAEAQATEGCGELLDLGTPCPEP